MARKADLPMRRRQIPSTPPELPNVEITEFSCHKKDVLELTDQYNEADNPSDPNDYCRTQIYKAFYPLMLSLKLVGLHYRRHNDKLKKGFSKPNVLQCYSWSLTMTSWIAFIKSLTTMRLVPSIGPLLFTNLVFSLILLLCTLNCTAFLLASHKPKKKRKLFMSYAKLKMYGGPFIDPAKIRKYVFIGTVIAWIVNVTNSSLCCFILFQTDVLSLFATDPFTDSQTGSLVMKIIFIGGIFYLSSMFIFGAFVDLSISLLLYYEFRLFGKYFRSLLSEDGAFSGSLENERRRYLMMTRVVDAADECMAIHHGASFTCGIANICLLMYCLIYYPSITRTFGVLVAYSFWITCSVFDIVVSCTCGILVNVAVGIL